MDARTGERRCVIHWRLAKFGNVSLFFRACFEDLLRSGLVWALLAVRDEANFTAHATLKLHDFMLLSVGASHMYGLWVGCSIPLLWW